MKALILDYLESTAERFPEKTAFADPETSVSFETLVRRAKAVGSALIPFVQPGMAIGFYPITNTAHDPERFALDRTEHSQAMAAMKKQGASMIATWFCHRDSEARMTAYEIQSAHDRDGSYLVLSLKDLDAPELCSYRVWGGRADKEELLLVP